MAPWCSSYHYCTTSLTKAWTQVLRRFKSCSRRVGDSRWWGSLAMVPAGNKATPFVGQPYHKNNSSSSSSSSSFFMFSCANLYYKYAKSDSYRVLNFRSVKITDMKSSPIWISYHFWTCKHWDKLDQKAIWLFSVSYRSILICFM